MASTSSFCSPILSFEPIPKFPTTTTNKKYSNKKTTRTKTNAIRKESHDRDFSGRYVDENLIVLRKRIHEMKMTERNYEPPVEWMDWEKGFYTSYDSIICDAMGHLQSYLMETRPSLALGMIALLMLSVPTSASLVMYNLVEVTKGVLCGIHLS